MRGGPPTEQDEREIVAFRRFLRLGVGPRDAWRIPREFPGWLPYCLGTGPFPPEGFDRVPVSAWTFPA